MRPDMGKVITERPRSGGGYKYAKGEPKAKLRVAFDEDQPKREKIRLKWIKNWNESKNFTDVLGPLRRYILGQVGRPWDKVLSEINKALPATGGISYTHARQHLFDFVEQNVIEIDGKPCYADGYLYGRPLGSGWHRDLVYVCPKTKILKRIKGSREKYRAKPKKSPYLWLGPYHLAEEVDGIWYVYEMKDVPRDAVIESYREQIGSPRQFTVNGTRDIFLKLYTPHKLTTNDWVYEILKNYGRLIYAVKRRQLNAAEIKRCKLRPAAVSQKPNLVRKHNKHKRG